MTCFTAGSWTAHKRTSLPRFLRKSAPEPIENYWYNNQQLKIGLSRRQDDNLVDHFHGFPLSLSLSLSLLFPPKNQICMVNRLKMMSLKVITSPGRNIHDGRRINSDDRLVVGCCFFSLPFLLLLLLSFFSSFFLSFLLLIIRICWQPATATRPAPSEMHKIFPPLIISLSSKYSIYIYLYIYFFFLVEPLF